MIVYGVSGISCWYVGIMEGIKIKKDTENICYNWKFNYIFIYRIISYNMFPWLKEEGPRNFPTIITMDAKDILDFDFEFSEVIGVL